MDSLDPPTIERLVRIETKLDMMVPTNADHEARIRSLEKYKWLLVGAAGALGGGVSTLLDLLSGG